MLEKNDFIERLKKMEMQSKQYRFAIRKLSIGAASVLLGSIFLGLNSSTVKADTVDADQHVSDEVVVRSDNKSKNIKTRKMNLEDIKALKEFIDEEKYIDLSEIDPIPQSILSDKEKGQLKDLSNEIADYFKERADSNQEVETFDKLRSECSEVYDKFKWTRELLREKRSRKQTLEKYASDKEDKEFPALTESQQQDIKSRIKNVIDYTSSKIDNVKPTNELELTVQELQELKLNEQELKEAITKVDHFEKGLPVNGEENVDYGEAAIDNIFKSIHKNNGNSGTGTSTDSESNVDTGAGTTSNSSSPITNIVKQPKDKEVDTTAANGEEVTLMHNAYLYDIDRTRSSKVILKAGSIVTTYGIKQINGKEHYILIDKGANNKKYYISVGNVKYLVRKLKKNAFVYNKYGNRIKKAGIIKKGQTVKTYGDIVNINGKKFFIIKKGQYVKANNVDIKKIVSENAEVEVVPVKEQKPDGVKIIERVLMHNAYLYDENGLRCNKLILKAGSVVEPVSKEKINGRSFYGLANGMYIAAGNIDAKKLKLKHNAYVYRSDGIRLGKKVLKKQKSVKTYGDPVKIKHKMYYITAKGKHVKKANFI